MTNYFSVSHCNKELEPSGYHKALLAFSVPSKAELLHSPPAKHRKNREGTKQRAIGRTKPNLWGGEENQSLFLPVLSPISCKKSIFYKVTNNLTQPYHRNQKEPPPKLCLL
jgi:hypothetical protein